MFQYEVKYDLWKYKWNEDVIAVVLASKKIRGFNVIRTRGLCVRAAVIYHLSYEDPYNGKQAN